MKHSLLISAALLLILFSCEKPEELPLKNNGTNLKSVAPVIKVVPVCPAYPVQTFPLTLRDIMEIYKWGYQTGVDKGNLNSFSTDSLEISKNFN